MVYFLIMSLQEEEKLLLQESDNGIMKIIKGKKVAFIWEIFILERLGSCKRLCRNVLENTAI